MHVIWKRPDGFQNALPNDFRRIALSNGAHLWLHCRELDWYPFQVSGDWEGQEQTKRLNRMVNQLDASHETWKDFLSQLLDNDFNFKDEQTLNNIANYLIAWIQELEHSLKGHTWELEIIRCALKDVFEKLNQFI